MNECKDVMKDIAFSLFSLYYMNDPLPLLPLLVVI